MPPASCAEQAPFLFQVPHLLPPPGPGHCHRQPGWWRKPPSCSSCLGPLPSHSSWSTDDFKHGSQSELSKKRKRKILSFCSEPSADLSPGHCPPPLPSFPPVFTGSLATSPASSGRQQPPDLHILIFACCLYSPTSVFAPWGQKLWFWFVCVSTNVSPVPRTEPGMCRR